MDLILNNEEKVLNVAEENTIYINGKNSKLTINVGSNTIVTIIESDALDVDVTLNLLNDSVCYYQVLSLHNKAKRCINLNKSAYFELTAIALTELTDDTTINLNGDHAEVKVTYLNVAMSVNQDINTTINHLALETKSTINNIGVVLDNANILFNTIGFVENGIPKCDCRQLSRGIVVGENSTIKSRPILLINEYDVKAYHGASIGKMSDDELFYLMSRGLSKTDAFILILNGLIAPIIADIRDEDLKVLIEEKINKLIG